MCSGVQTQSLCNKRPSLLLFASHVTFDVCIHIQTLKLMVEGNNFDYGLETGYET